MTAGTEAIGLSRALLYYSKCISVNHPHNILVYSFLIHVNTTSMLSNTEGLTAVLTWNDAVRVVGPNRRALPPRKSPILSYPHNYNNTPNPNINKKTPNPFAR